jgi:NitT/TauT family transport system substrate-binding protein
MKNNMKVLAALLAAVISTGPAWAADTLQVGTTGVISDAPFFIADKEGYFRDEGISVNFNRFDSAAKMVAPLGAGQLDVGGGATSAALFNAAKRGVNIRIVADKARNSPHFGFQSLMVRQDLLQSGAVKSFADLKGAKIAISSKGNSEEFLVQIALAKGGLTLADIDEVYLGFAEHAPAFANKAITASITTEPTVSFIEAAGTAKILAGVDQIYPNFQTAVTYYGADFITHKPDQAQRFMHALLRGMRTYLDAVQGGKIHGPAGDRLIETMLQYGQIKDANVYRTMTASGLDPNGEINLDSLRATWNFFKDTKQIDGSVTMDDVIDMSFARRATQELGPFVSNQ